MTSSRNFMELLQAKWDEGKFARVADQLFEIGAIKFAGFGDAPVEGFKLKLHETKPDAPLSPIYLNLRTPENPNPGPLTPRLVDDIANLLYGLVHITEGIDFKYYAGIPRAGVPFAQSLDRCFSSWSRVQRIELEKAEADGKRKISQVVPGEWSPPGMVLLIDDLITQADTKIEAVEALEQAGLSCTDLLVVVNRQQGGVGELWTKKEVRVISAFRLTEILDHYVAAGRIDQAMADTVMAYTAANRV